MKRSNARLRFLYTLVIFFVCAVIANVFLVTIGHVHFRSNTSLEDYIDTVFNVEETIYASRGTIYDGNGFVLAKDVQTYDIICYLDSDRLSNGSDIAYVDNPSFAANALAPILDMDAQEIYDRLTANPDLYQVELGANGRNLSKEQVEQIEAIDGLHGIGFRNSYKRYYPYGMAVSPQLVGYARSNDEGKLIGELGLEEYLNNELSGTDGYHSYQHDKNGYILPGMYDETIDAIDGYDVYLTLDASIQEALNTCLDTTIKYKSASRAWGAVVEIKTGKILAWSQTPSFDPNNLNSNDVQVNYGSQLAYEPGSTMKSIIYAAAMDLGVYDGEEMFDSSPYCYDENYIDRVYANYDKCVTNYSNSDWGNIPLDYGLIYSSNVATSTLLSKYVGEKNYQDYLDRFHLYKKVNTDGIYEIPGVCRYGISAADSLNATFGTGSSITMLQVLQAYSSIFGNGEMIKPYYIDKIVNPNDGSIIYQGSREVVGNPISEDTAKSMQKLLRRVVSDPNGTCRHYEAKTVNVMGKTGTATLPLDGSYSEDEDIISCMLGFPYENPEYMVYYAYISKETLYYNYDIKPIPDLIDRIALLENLNFEENTNVTENIFKYEMPNVTSKSVIDATDVLKEYNVNIIKIGDGDKVLGQYPRKNDDVYTNEKVFLLTNGDNITLPNFTNWTRKELINYWNLSGVPIQINGYGVVYGQSVLPNSIVDKNKEIVVYLQDIDMPTVQVEDSND